MPLRDECVLIRRTWMRMRSGVILVCAETHIVTSSIVDRKSSCKRKQSSAAQCGADNTIIWNMRVWCWTLANIRDCTTVPPTLLHQPDNDGDYSGYASDSPLISESRHAGHDPPQLRTLWSDITRLFWGVLRKETLLQTIWRYIFVLQCQSKLINVPSKFSN